eukprot:scaffold555422_cov41-Prasinocladus_malaysianus.AAC.1
MKIMVFDEADEMLKADGFADDSIRMIRDIKKASPDCQVFVPKEDLSLDVIKQYRVVRPALPCPDPADFI